MELTDFRKIASDTEHILYRKPIIKNNVWFCEAFYKPDKIGKKILVRTPRMKVTGKIRKCKKGHMFAVSFSDRDIDDDIQDFYEFILKLDAKFKIKFNDLNKTYRLFEPKDEIKYRSLKRKTSRHSYYMNIKLLETDTDPDTDTDTDTDNELDTDIDIYIESKDNEPESKDNEPEPEDNEIEIKSKSKILTKIHDDNRKELTIEDITYGFYVDQYIEYCGIWGDTKAKIVSPVWVSHQIVRSEQEKQFLSCLLLDDVSPKEPSPRFPPPPPGIRSFRVNDIVERSRAMAMLAAEEQPKPVTEPQKETQKEPIKKPPHPLKIAITADLIKSMKSRLRKAQIIEN